MFSVMIWIVVGGVLGCFAGLAAFADTQSGIALSAIDIWLTLSLVAAILVLATFNFIHRGAVRFLAAS